MNAVLTFAPQGQVFTPEALLDRRKWIGGSDAAAAIGLNPYRSQFDLWQEKLGLVEPFKGNEATLWGQLHEPVVRQQYAERLNKVVRLPTETVFHPQIKWMGCHPDGVTEDRRLYEGKTARYADNWGEELTDQIPEHYLIQCQHSMIVTGLLVTDVAVLIGGNELRFYEVAADTDLQTMIVEGEAKFWDYVENNRAPPPDLTRADAVKVLQRMYPGSNGQSIEADEAMIKARDQYTVASENAKLAAEMKDEAKAQMLAFMGENTFLTFPTGGKLRRQITSRKPYSVAATSFMDFRSVKA